MKKDTTSLPKKAINRGGRRPKDAGRRKEREFANKYEEFTRVIGSGAFGGQDPTLQGDLKGQIGDKRFLLEMKAWATVNAAGEKTITVPLSVLDKILKEAETENRFGGLIFVPKGTTRNIAIFEWDDFYFILKDQEDHIARLTRELESLGA